MIFQDISDFLRQPSEKPKLIVIVGPTASGKTAFSLEVAQKFSGEIVNADSRQLYRGLEIGSAQPTDSEKGDIPHHLFGILDPKEEGNVALWKEKAKKIISEITSRQKIPIVCGGTGLFVNALTKNFTIPQIPPNTVFRDTKEKLSAEELWDELFQKDPLAAEKIPKQNKRYVIRALEIAEFLGKKSEVIGVGEEDYDTFFIGVVLPRKKLYDKINARVEGMKGKGFLDEVRKLMTQGYSEKDPGMNAHGYPEAIQFLKGELSEDVLWETMKQNTRNYAKRQLTWWRRDARIHWIDGETLDSVSLQDPEF
jgi:tRNA dimethylallyltransferase